TPVTQGRDDGFGFAHNDDVLFAQIHLPESALSDIEQATHDLYRRLDGLLQRRGFTHCLRIWTYLSDINAGADDRERYRLFTAGRSRALALRPGDEHYLPAATAIGSDGGGLVMYLLAGRLPGIAIENPRQVSAFRYPRQYGPRSPSFSRATLIGAGSVSRM